MFARRKDEKKIHDKIGHSLRTRSENKGIKRGLTFQRKNKDCMMRGSTYREPSLSKVEVIRARQRGTGREGKK